MIGFECCSMSCEGCEYTVSATASHTKGEWEIMPDGSKEMRCTLCGTVVNTRAPEKEKSDVPAEDSNNKDLIKWIIIISAAVVFLGAAVMAVAIAFKKKLK